MKKIHLKLINVFYDFILFNYLKNKDLFNESCN